MTEPGAGAPIAVRRYASADAETTLTIFQEAIAVTAAADYGPEQVAAWARPGGRDVEAWDRSMRSRHSYVAVVGGQVAGFSDVGGDGYVDMMYVSPHFARRGVAKALMACIEDRARHLGAAHLHAHVSITARPFFEGSGFCVVAERSPTIDGVSLTNFHMRKVLEPLR